MALRVPTLFSSFSLSFCCQITQSARSQPESGGEKNGNWWLRRPVFVLSCVLALSIFVRNSLYLQCNPNYRDMQNCNWKWELFVRVAHEVSIFLDYFGSALESSLTWRPSAREITIHLPLWCCFGSLHNSMVSKFFLSERKEYLKKSCFQGRWDGGEDN
jgi:hypothetical protein